MVLHHAECLMVPGLTDGGLQVSPLRAFTAAGQTGVSLFFVLSAFCLSLPLFRAVQAGQPVSWTRFYERRALRILPAYWTAVAVGAVATGMAWEAPLGVLPWAVFLNSLPDVGVRMSPFSDVWWSLATEVQFYLLLPLLPAALATPARRRMGVAFLLACALVYALYQFGWFNLRRLEREIHLCLSIFGRGPVFLAGIAVAWAWSVQGPEWKRRLEANRLLRNGGGDLVLLAVLAALGFLLSWLVWTGYWPAERRRLQTWHIAEGALWGLVLASMLALPLRSKALFCNRILGRLGDWSYSIYLVHLPVIVYGLGMLRQGWAFSYQSWNPDSILAVLLMVAGTIALSSLTYRFLEKPFLVKKAGLSG